MSETPTRTQAWQALREHHARMEGVHLRELFGKDPGRAERFSVEAAGLFLDYSKNRITEETLQLLLALAHERGVAERRDAMYRGEKVNTTEARAVLVALRAPGSTRILVDGSDVVPEIHAVLDRMADFSERVRSGVWTGHTGKRLSARRVWRSRWKARQRRSSRIASSLATVPATSSWRIASRRPRWGA